MTPVSLLQGSTVAALKHAIIDGHFDMPDYLSQDCMEIINGILRLKPSLRMTTLQVLVDDVIILLLSLFNSDLTIAPPHQLETAFDC